MKEIPGLWPGQVVDTKDPLGLRRIKVRVPALHGTVTDQTIKDSDLPWAVPCFPFGGPTYGDDYVPGVRAQVWVAFQLGDPHAPVWLGVPYATGEGPSPELAQTGPANSEPKGNYRKTAGGWLIGFNEKSPESKFEVKAPGEAMVFTMDTTKNEMSLLTQQGQGIKIDLTTGKVQIVGLPGALPLAGIVTTNHVCAYTGSPHPQGSLEVEATG